MAGIMLTPYFMTSQCPTTNGVSGSNQISATVTPSNISVISEFDGFNTYYSGTVRYSLSNLIIGRWNPSGDMDFHLLIKGASIKNSINLQSIKSGTALTSYTFTFSNLCIAGNFQ